MNLIDTTLLIDFTRGSEKAAFFLEQQSCKISIITIGELFQGMKTKTEYHEIERLCKEFVTLPLTEIIGNKSIELLKQHHLSHGLLMLDALIAATAIENKLKLVTANTKHFFFIKELTVVSWKQE